MPLLLYFRHLFEILHNQGINLLNQEMLDFVQKACMVGEPKFLDQARRRKQKKTSGKLSLVIRPRSLLCSMNQEEIYSNANYFQRQSNTWKFHRPKSCR